MPQSLSLINVHLVFSTKDRTPYLSDDILPAAHAYMAAVARNSGCACYRVGGIADHVHLAIRIPRTKSIANIVEDLKSTSSKWLKTQSPKLHSFAWQRGYGAFSVGSKEISSLLHYIENQAEHHRTRTFQEEYLELLKDLGIEYDERYLWD